MLNRSLSLFLSYTPCFETTTSIAQQQKRLALFRDRRLLWGILTSAALPTPFDCSYAPFTYGWASDALCFCGLLRTPRLRLPIILPNVFMPTAVSLWAFLRPLDSLAVATRHPLLRFAANQISEYGRNQIWGLITQQKGRSLKRCG